MIHLDWSCSIHDRPKKIEIHKQNSKVQVTDPGKTKREIYRKCHVIRRDSTHSTPKNEKLQTTSRPVAIQKERLRVQKQNTRGIGNRMPETFTPWEPSSGHARPSWGEQTHHRWAKCWSCRPCHGLAWVSRARNPVLLLRKSCAWYPS